MAIEVLIAVRDFGPYQKGDVVMAKPEGAPWGRREKRPPRGHDRMFAIARVNDSGLESRMAGKPLGEPYRDVNSRSAKTLNVDALSAQAKTKISDRRSDGKIGDVTLVNRSRVR